MTTERCALCRFWLPVEEGVDRTADDAGHGWCRREPPKIVDHMARMAIPQPGFGGHVFDPEDVADAGTVHNACLWPATFYTEWCGQFEGSDLLVLIDQRVRKDRRDAVL
ncbi:hypothetical protein ABC347_10825 [Sphingomonas sp. 1P06PA]|uniref:hypothetical protein n=1 Tax=Sphingomonas sp. 1P06PA TaxID=554121 RepID=UPI0039A4F96B